jgi:thiamine kinase-like enzyme
MFEVDNNNKISDITFKQTQPTTWLAFTGVMYIYHWERFFNNLKTIDSAEFIYSISRGSDVASLETWQDFGCPISYRGAVSKSLAFDFSKEDEITYICNNKVIKWWVDSTVAKKKYTKTLSNPTVFPTNCQHLGNYMSYDFFPGKTLYEHNTAESINNLLTWLHDTVWLRNNNDICTESSAFYKDKTLNRINQFLKKHTSLPVIKTINGVEVKEYTYYLENINWDALSTDNLTGFIHGDLQFDNIIINENDEFKIIDWRHEFGGLVEYGDIYYDLAKMSGGFIINYARIKNHQFAIQIDGNTVTLDSPSIDDIKIYQAEIKNYVDKHNLNYKKVQQLVPIIFWNMSPLHFEPFDMFLWYLGIKLFQEIENENIH